MLEAVGLLVDRVIIAILLSQKFALIVFDSLFLSPLFTETFIFVSAWTRQRLLSLDFIFDSITCVVAHILLAARVVCAFLQHFVYKCLTDKLYENDNQFCNIDVCLSTMGIPASNPRIAMIDLDSVQQIKFKPNLTLSSKP